jgi:putative oxidoreductase
MSTNAFFTNISLLLLRWITGVILFVAGAGKVFAWFGGYGMEKTVEAFKNMMGINSFLAYVSSYTELIGGLLLILGLFTRPAAFAVWINMLVATIVSLPFFAKNGPGASFPCTLAVISFAILLMGPGVFSIDALLFRPKKISKRY